MGNEVSIDVYQDFVIETRAAKQDFIQAGVRLGYCIYKAKKRLSHGQFLQYLKEVDLPERTAQRLMERAQECLTNPTRVSDLSEKGVDPRLTDNENFIDLVDSMTVKEFNRYKKYPEEVKEDVANSKDKEEAEKKIKEYERQLKEEREANDVLIKSNQQLQDQLEKEQKTKKVEYRTNEVEVPPNDYDELKYKASQYDEERKKNIELGKKIGEVQNEKTNIRYEYENKMRNIQQKYDEIKKSLEEMDLEEEKLYKYVRQDKELGQFVGDVQVLLLDRLASFNYSAYLDDDVNKYNVDMLAKLINQIRRWCNDMENMIEKYTEEFEEQENKEDENIIEIENVEVE